VNVVTGTPNPQSEAVHVVQGAGQVCMQLRSPYILDQRFAALGAEDAVDEDPGQGLRHVRILFPFEGKARLRKGAGCHESMLLFLRVLILPITGRE